MEIGPYTLSKGSVPEGDKPPFTQVPHVFIRRQSGEMMSVRESVFEQLINKFYKENF